MWCDNCDKCDNFENCDQLWQYDQFWQLWPIVTIMNNCVLLWQFWRIMTILTNLILSNSKSKKSILVLADWVWPPVSHVLSASCMNKAFVSSWLNVSVVEQHVRLHWLFTYVYWQCPIVPNMYLINETFHDVWRQAHIYHSAMPQ